MINREFCPAIVTDVRYRMSLPIIKELYDEGIPVYAVEYDSVKRNKRLGFLSKYINNSYLIHANENEDNFIDNIIRIVGQISKQHNGRKPVLIPVGIKTYYYCSRNSNRLKEYVKILISDDLTLKKANDTLLLSEYAKRAKVPFPSTTLQRKDESLDSLANRLIYPVVIKYREGEILGLKPKHRYKIVENSEQFKEYYIKMQGHQDRPIIQQKVMGPGFGVSVVMDENSNPVSLFCHKRIREYPITGGPSCMCKSVYNEQLIEYSVNLLKQLNFKGIAMVEFKGDEQNGFYLMEINPRIWGSFSLSYFSNAKLILSLYYKSLDERFKVEPYKTNVFMRFFVQDWLCFFSSLKHNNNKIRFIQSFVKSIIKASVYDGVFSLRDIKVSLRYFLNCFKK